MSHFTEGVLQAYLDEEVVADARAQVSAHVSGCADCAVRLQELRGASASFATAMAALDREPIAQATLAELRLRAEQRSWRDRLRTARWPWTRAAIVVLSVAAVAAAPGSPVRGWLVGAWAAITPEPAVPVATVKESPTPERVPDTPTGFQIAPASGRVRIMLQGQPDGTTVHVVLVDAEKASIEASTVGDSPRHRKGSGWFELVGGGTGDIRISLPRSLTSATVEVDGRVFVSKQGDQLRYLGPTPPIKTGPELIFKPAR